MRPSFFDRRESAGRRLYCHVGRVWQRAEFGSAKIRKPLDQQNPNRNAVAPAGPEAGQSPRPEAGQSLVESTFVLLVFFVLLFGVIDCGQVLVAHQSLVERVRGAVRWGVVRPFDGTGDQIANLVLYNETEEPRASKEGFLGLSRENVVVSYRPPTAERPDDETLSVAIVNYHYHFLSPWVGKTLINPRPVLMSSPMAFRSAAITPPAAVVPPSTQP